jgi:hypothetical protein
VGGCKIVCDKGISMLIIEASEIRGNVLSVYQKKRISHTSNVWTLESHIPEEERLYLNIVLKNKIIGIDKRGVKMRKIKEEDLQYIYQKNEKKGVIMDIQIFEALMEMLENHEDAVDFEVLKTEETMDYEEYRRSRLKQNV